MSFLVDRNRWELLYPKECTVCKSALNLQTCSICHSVYYCSKQHQIQDWKQHHKPVCSILKGCYEDNLFLSDPINILVLPGNTNYKNLNSLASNVEKIQSFENWESWIALRNIKNKRESYVRCLTDKMTFSLTIFNGIVFLQVFLTL